MNILLTGLCTVHYGRMENGNIGNYYIIETTVRELHRVFSDTNIFTTFQMTDEFCEREKVKRLNMDLYYSWNEDDVPNAMLDYGIAKLYSKGIIIQKKTKYIELIETMDLVCDFSGEMWGDHAEPVGENRFFVNLLKIRVAQLLGKKTVLLAGSQGPFEKTKWLLPFAKEVFKNFDLVLSRESASIDLLKEYGFDIKNASSYTDPAFLFEPVDNDISRAIIEKEIGNFSPTVGFILCGFNMLDGPYDKEPRRDEEFTQFVELVEYIINDLGCKVILMSHQNGFKFENNQIVLINGRDYPYAKRLYELTMIRQRVDQKMLTLAEGPYNAKITKALIGKFDMFISGRIHAFVAATSQYVPTVIINRGHGGKSHRNLGFARSIGFENYISDPSSSTDMQKKVKECWDNRIELRKELKRKIPVVKNIARELFDQLKKL